MITTSNLTTKNRIRQQANTGFYLCEKVLADKLHYLQMPSSDLCILLECEYNNLNLVIKITADVYIAYSVNTFCSI